MPLDLVRLPAAEADLLELWDYIAQDSPRAADRMLDRITSVLETLRDNPLAGRARSELREGLRSIVCGNYILYYRVSE